MDPVAEQPPMVAAAKRARIKASRTAVLFAALAAEAYVNEFLRAHIVDDKDFKAIQWMRTEDKFLVGTQLVYGERVFLRDREGARELHDLLELRNRLVHPKPGFGVAAAHGDADADFESHFALPIVAEYIVAVGGYADAMTWRAYGYGHIDVPARVFWGGRDVIRAFARRREDLPAWNAPAERPLFRQAGDHVMAMKPLPDAPNASWTRLRKAQESRKGSTNPTD